MDNTIITHSNIWDTPLLVIFPKVASFLETPQMQLPWHWETSAFNFCPCRLSQVATACHTRLERQGVLNWRWLWIPITLKLNYSASRMQLYLMSCASSECCMLDRLNGANCDTTINALRCKISSTRLQVSSLKSLPPTDLWQSRSVLETCPYPSHAMESAQRIRVSHQTNVFTNVWLRMRDVCWYHISSKRV